MRSDASIAAMSPAHPPARPATLGEIFRAFTWVSLQGFGGVLAPSQRMLCEDKRWLSHRQFVALLALAQVLPGASACNLALIVGDRFFGWRGAVTALAALMAAPLVLLLLLTVAYAHYAHVPAVAGAVRGMTVVSAGLIAAAGLKLLPALRTNVMRRPACLLASGATFGAIALLGFPLGGVLLVVGALAVGYAWWRLGMAAHADGTAAPGHPRPPRRT